MQQVFKACLQMRVLNWSIFRKVLDAGRSLINEIRFEFLHMSSFVILSFSFACAFLHTFLNRQLHNLLACSYLINSSICLASIRGILRDLSTAVQIFFKTRVVLMCPFPVRVEAWKFHSTP